MDIEPYLKNKGISPVVGVILLVALVVALITLASVIVFNIGDDSDQDAADTAVDITQTSSGVQVRVLKNNNVDEYKIQFPDGNTQILSGEVGSSLNLVGPEGLYTVVAVLEDGQEQTILTKEISSLDYSGVFIVQQNEEKGEVNATLRQKFDNIDDYELQLETTASGETTTELQSFDFESQSTVLSERLVNEQSKDKGRKILNLINISATPEQISNAVSIGETIEVHEMVNFCKGDELQLADADTDDTLASEEIVVGNDCNALRKIARYYDNGTIKGVELVNLWNQQLSYFVFQYDGQPQPELPTTPTPTTESGGVNVTAYVYDNATSDPIEGATVVLGDKRGTTNASGEHKFTGIDPGEDATVNSNINKIEATAYKPGWGPAPVRVVPDSEDPIDWNNPQREEFGLDKLSFSSPTYSANSNIGGGGSTFVPTSSYSGSGGGITVGGGGPIGGGGTSLGAFYSGGSPPDTVTFSRQVPAQPQAQQLTVQPERVFNVIEIDDSLIPTGEKFRVDTTVASNGGQDLTDEIIVYKSKIGSKSLTEIGRATAVLPSDGTNTVEQEFTIDGSWDLGEHTIYVELANSDEAMQSAGKLDVFDGAKTGATINGGTVTPEDPKIGVDESSTNVTVTVDETDINFNGASNVTVDIFENGYRVAEGTVSADGTETLEFVGNYTEQQYVQYHVGIQESQDVSILDTVIVRKAFESPDITKFDANIQIQDRTDCGVESYTSGQFDCEVDINDTSHSITFNSTGSTFTDGDGNNITDMTYKWVLGSERVVEYTQSDIEDGSVSHDVISQTFTENTVHLVELRAQVEIDGQTYDSRDSLFINAINDSARFESQIVNTDVDMNNEVVTVDVKNTKETIPENVTVEFYKPSDSPSYYSSTTPINKTTDVRVNADSIKSISKQLNYEDYADDPSTLEGGDKVPFEVAVRPADNERYQDADGGPWMTKDLVFTVPEASIDVTAEATVEICYDGSCT